jgi:hypothetical protein
MTCGEQMDAPPQKRQWKTWGREAKDINFSDFLAHRTSSASAVKATTVWFKKICILFFSSADLFKSWVVHVGMCCLE